MNTYSGLKVMAALIAASAPASAQSAQLIGGGVISVTFRAMMSPAAASLTIDMLPPSLVNNLMNTPARTGAPYSATVVASASRIGDDDSREAVAARAQQSGRETMTYRDSMGRVRMDEPRPAILKTYKTVTIRDVVAGYEYFLDVENQVAHRMPLPSGRPQPTAEFDDQPFAQMPRQPESGGPGITKTFETLGPKEVAGVSFVGRRITTTYGPGSNAGRDHPVTTLSEFWFAPGPGIQTSVRTTSLDGIENTTTVIDLKTTEPDPALFQIPPDYRIQDETGPFTIDIRR